MTNTKRNTKPAATKPVAAAKVAPAVVTKRNAKVAVAAAKQAAAKPTRNIAAKGEGFSAAKVLLACGVTNAKVGRALLRAHNIERTEKAIKAFFAARTKARAKA